jgi:hypothetical protein
LIRLYVGPEEGTGGDEKEGGGDRGQEGGQRCTVQTSSAVWADAAAAIVPAAADAAVCQIIVHGVV